MSSSSQAVYAAIAADVAVAVAKFVAAGFTGSASMLSEGVHSLIDSCNGLLLLWGQRAGGRPPDDTHPFGYGKEVYFWALIVALLIFALGGGVSACQGLLRLVYPRPIEHPAWDYGVLGIAALCDGYAWSTALRQLRAERPQLGFMDAVRASKDPATFAVLFEDSAALVGVAVAFLGILLSQWLGSPYPDGVASVLVGLVLAAVAILLACESKKLLVGESADVAAVDSIRALAEADPAVACAGCPLTMHLGPREVLLNLDIQFRDELSADEIAEAVDRLERSIRGKHADITRIFIEVERLTPAHRRDRAGLPQRE